MKKKTYQAPAMLQIRINTTRMMALSTDVNATGLSESAGGDNVQLVKGNRDGGYNVWDDDWNK